MSSAEAVLSWSELSKSYSRRPLFNGLSGAIASGQSLVVSGANGSGKSTFLKIAVGLLSADNGLVFRPHAAQIGYCAPSMELYGDLTGLENMQFFAGVVGLGTERCTELLTEAGLSRSASRLYSSYSSGMKQRLKLAFALLREPKLLVLDEPTSALDSEGVRFVDDLIARHRTGGGAALIASNDREEALRWADLRLPIGPQAW